MEEPRAGCPAQCRRDRAAGALKDAKARNVKAVRALLDEDALRGDDGSVNGLDQQLSKIREENGFLFGEDQDAPYVVRGAGSSAAGAEDEKLRRAFGLPVRR